MTAISILSDGKESEPILAIKRLSIALKFDKRRISKITICFKKEKTSVVQIKLKKIDNSILFYKRFKTVKLLYIYIQFSVSRMQDFPKSFSNVFTYNY